MIIKVENVRRIQTGVYIGRYNSNWCAPLACHGDVLKKYIENHIYGAKGV